jgi:hypothetical protein
MEKYNFSNNATTKLLGYDYQKLIALECCLNAKRNDHIWIECKGDVADDIKSIEVKHHIGEGYITSNSEDVWKTIKNYITEYDTVELFNSLVLYTTSVARNNSIFYEWNSLSVREKMERIISHSPSATVQDYHKLITSFSKENLSNILEKFSILEGQPKVQEKWNELKEHSTFTIIPENFRGAALEQLYGYITKKAIDDSNEWKIKVNDFKKDIQYYLSSYTTGSTPFPVVGSNDPAITQNKKHFIFLDKMKAVKLNIREQNNAVSDYLRANISQFKLLKMTPTLVENMKIYDENIKRNIEEEKGCQCVGFTIEKLETDEAHIRSMNLYFACIKKQHENIIGVNDTQKYYRDGRIHYTLENTDFEWKLKEEDL